MPSNESRRGVLAEVSGPTRDENRTNREAASSIDLQSGWHRSYVTQHSNETGLSHLAKDTLLTPLGKRKWWMPEDERVLDSGKQRLDEEDGMSTLMTLNVVNDQSEAKQLRQHPDLHLDESMRTVIELPAQCQNVPSGPADWSRKKVCQHLVPSRAQQCQTAIAAQSASEIGISLPVPLNAITKDQMSPPKLRKASLRAQRRISRAEGPTENATEQLSSLVTETDHPLSKLRWPFDGNLFEGEANRGGGGGGGSQPSTTGSQGFPQFITAGPSMCLFGHDLFGYDRESLMGYISWA